MNTAYNSPRLRSHYGRHLKIARNLNSAASLNTLANIPQLQLTKDGFTGPHRTNLNQTDLQIHHGSRSGFSTFPDNHGAVDFRTTPSAFTQKTTGIVLKGNSKAGKAQYSASAPA